MRHTHTIGRRAFLEQMSRAGLSAWLAGVTHRITSPAANVRDYGARGDGRTDDTSAFARCIASLPSGPGTVVVPTGIYLIDPRKSVVLTDNITLALASDAVLKAIPVRDNQSAVVRGRSARNVVVINGAIVGERAGHLGSTGEWGMGIDLRGCPDARIENVNISECWGDGIYVGGDRGRESERLVVKGCVGHGNRRQGLSITGCIGALIEDCEFSDTRGTAPESGIDLEPNGNSIVRDVTISNCRLLRNAGYGVSFALKNVVNARLTGSHMAFNSKGGVQVLQATNPVVEQSYIENNGRYGVWVTRSASGSTISKNSIRANSVSSPGQFDNVFVDKGSTNTVVSDNTFIPDVAQADPARYDVRIDSPDCVGTIVARNRLRPRVGSRGGVDDHGTGTQII